MKKQDIESLRSYFGNNYPQKPDQAKDLLRDEEASAKSLRIEGKDYDPIPANIYAILQILICKGMGKGVAPKRKERRRGKGRSITRTT